MSSRRVGSRSMRRLGCVAGITIFTIVGCGGPGGSPDTSNGVPSSTPAAARTADPALAQMRADLAALAHRKQLIEDANDIKRLQRAYGYYVDEAQWDEVADLFAEDGSIELGLDGIYVGKRRIREYLYALGGGESGLSRGEINEHMMLMPVVTVAPDGQTARGRWRAIIMAGQLGESAIWGEGPYENAYVKEDGVWKLKAVYWHQAVVVPYEGGWQVNADINGGKWASDQLPPDRPPSVEYETWPGTYLPPFHFPNPVLGAEHVDYGSYADASAYTNLDREALLREAGVLTQEVQLLEDENSIENLQRIYGFYIEEGFWSEAASLFADDATIEIAGSGVYEGQSRVLEYLRSRGAEYPQNERLFDRMQLQPIVHVAPDGQSAQARWRLFAQEAQSGEFANWGVGAYENTYIKDNGIWKIKSLHAHHKMYSPYEDGWGVTALANDGPSLTLPPDQPPTRNYAAYPDAETFPFHFTNPVTGAPVYTEAAASFATAIDASAFDATLAAIDTRIERLEDNDQLERLNAIYGYYLAHSQWDNLAGIFAPNGSIEIAMRGVYIGRPSVRRNLNLYTELGMHHGLLHNHMQYQPVITIADDGATAKMRSRAFSIMGQYEAYSMWMGGIYENDLVKIDGVWQIQRDQVFNTYFAPYAVGWKDLGSRPPPGITDSNPPDAPPSHPFDMFPVAFVPPYHYPNPVTGNAVIWPIQD